VAESRVVLVTGGSKGIGRAIAEAFLAAGDHVIVCARNAADALPRSGAASAEFMACDVKDLESVKVLFAGIVQRYGRLDVLVNNAGATWGVPLEEHDQASWDRVLNLNVAGVFHVTKFCLPLLRAAGTADEPARVINIGSIDGLKSAIFDTFSYGASKAAVHHLTRFLASHLTKDRILCNAIAPGPFPTWMLSTGVGFGGKTDGVDWDVVGSRNPSGRVGTPQDIAGLAIFLSSRAGEYVVCQTIACDGGVVGTS